MRGLRRMRDYSDDPGATRAPARGALTAAAISVAATLAGVAALWAFWPEISSWARETQQMAQTTLARAVQAARAGDPWAVWALLGACATYGVAHAVGPGHGKLLIGGAAAASRRTAGRMAAIGFAASLAQGLAAIALMYGALGLASLSASWATATTERVLAPVSTAAIALVGLWLAWRGARGLWRMLAPPARAEHARGEAARHAHDHGSPGHVCHAGCRHGPTVTETERAENWREVAALILSIGARPCSGALIVLAISWSFGLAWLGALGALTMAAGTGAVVAAVGLAAATARDGAQLKGDGRTSRLAFSGVQLGAGLLIAVSATALTVAALQTPPPPAGLFGTR